MASMAFDSYWHDLASDNINPVADATAHKIFVALLSAAGVAAANKKTWSKMSHVTGELAASGNYVAGGWEVTVSSTNDTTNDRNDVALGGTTQASCTFSAYGALYYKKNGGASSADELIALNDFGGGVSPSGGTFTLNASTLRIQN